MSSKKKRYRAQRVLKTGRAGTVARVTVREDGTERLEFRVRQPDVVAPGVIAKRTVTHDGTEAAKGAIKEWIATELGGAHCRGDYEDAASGKAVGKAFCTVTIRADRDARRFFELTCKKQGITYCSGDGKPIIPDEPGDTLETRLKNRGWRVRQTVGEMADSVSVKTVEKRLANGNVRRVQMEERAAVETGGARQIEVEVSGTPDALRALCLQSFVESVCEGISQNPLPKLGSDIPWWERDPTPAPRPKVDRVPDEPTLRVRTQVFVFREAGKSWVQIGEFSALRGALDCLRVQRSLNRTRAHHLTVLENGRTTVDQEIPPLS